MIIKKLFFDLETTGVDERKNSIHQMSGWIEMDDEIVDKFDWNVRPHPKARIDEEALEVGNVTEEQIQSYAPMEEIYARLIKLLGKHIDKYNSKDKMFLVGFNNRSFDDKFFRKFFEYNNDPYFGSWFWSHSIDVMVLASEDLIKERTKMKNFKLATVAKQYGIEVDSDKLHDSNYDLELTRDIYRSITGRDLF